MNYVSLWLYGALTLGSLFMMASWGLVALQSLREYPARQWLKERFVVIAVALHLHAVAATWLFGLLALRLLAGHVSGAPLVVLLPMLTLLISKIGLVWASSLNDNPRVWRLFILASIAWATFVTWEMTRGRL